MKKLLLLITIINFFACSSSDSIPKEGVLNIKINEIPSDLQNTYSYTDLNIGIYSNKEDYLNETNAIYAGNFDSEGKITISNNIKNNHIYFVDIYTNDNHLSNWSYTDLDKVNFTDGNILIAANNHDFFETIYLEKESRILIGEWKFAGYNGHNHTAHDRTEKLKLIINKDFSISTYEKYNNVNYTVNYKYKGNDVGYLSTSPSDSGYPYSGISNTSAGLKNPDGLSIGYDPVLKFVNFRDYADEFLLFKK